MRKADIQGPYGSAWKVPLERAQEWVREHPDRMHQSARDSLFSDVWRDYWLVRSYEQEDLLVKAYWRAVILRDLRVAPPDVERIYREAEWDVSVIECDRQHGAPPVNGDGIFEWDTADPSAVLLVYQFHGLSERQATALGDPRYPISFAQYVVEAMCEGKVKSDTEEWAHRFSMIVNGIRGLGYGESPRRALEIGPRQGFLVELEDGETISQPRPPLGAAGMSGTESLTAFRQRRLL